MSNDMRRIQDHPTTVADREYFEGLSGLERDDVWARADEIEAVFTRRSRSTTSASWKAAVREHRAMVTLTADERQWSDGNME
jgi:hypothetical protein